MLTAAQRQQDRSQFIYGSDIAAICGKSPWKTAVEVWLEKKGLKAIADISDKPCVQWGNELEPVIRNRFAREDNVRVVEFNDDLQHKKFDFLRGHVDGLLMNSQGQIDGVFEAKTTNVFNAAAWDEEVPADYLIQLSYYMALTNLDKGAMAVLIGGNDFRKYYFDRQPKLESNILLLATKFYVEHMLTDIPPPATTVEDVLLLHPVSNVKEVQASSGIEQALVELNAIKERIKLLQVTEKGYKDVICAHMGDADTLKDAQNRVIATWRSAAPSITFDHRLFAARCPKLYARYLRETPGSRRFLPKDVL